LPRILIVGVPRSGTTWIAGMLAHADEATLVFEPDNHQMYPYAFKAKRNLRGGYYPIATAECDLHLYERLWRDAFGDSGTSYTRSERARRAVAQRLLRWRRDEQVVEAFTSTKRVTRRLRVAEALAVPERPLRECRNLLVKSVYTPLAVEWVAGLVDAQVVIVFRDLRNIVSSWSELGWIVPRGEDELLASDPEVQESLRLRLGVPPVSIADSPIGRLTWLLALYTTALEDAVRRNPQWVVVRHEEAVSDLPHSLQALAGALGLRWTERAARATASAAKPGRGFEISRMPDTLRDAWTRRLTEAQSAEVDDVLARFPLEAPNSS
jgi:Sulfotransferase family